MASTRVKVENCENPGMLNHKPVSVLKGPKSSGQGLSMRKNALKNRSNLVVDKKDARFTSVKKVSSVPESKQSSRSSAVKKSSYVNKQMLFDKPKMEAACVPDLDLPQDEYPPIENLYGLPDDDEIGCSPLLLPDPVTHVEPDFEPLYKPERLIFDKDDHLADYIASLIRDIKDKFDHQVLQDPLDMNDLFEKPKRQPPIFPLID